VFERFTDRSRRVLVLAQEEARLLEHSFIGTEHILLGLIHEGEGVAAKALQSMDVSLEAVREKVKETIGLAGSAPTGSPPFTPRAKKVLALSLREALQLGHSYIGTEHLLLGLVREGEGVAAQVLRSLGADLPRVRREVMQLLSGRQSEDPVTARASPSLVGASNPRARVVLCSFCGRGPPESGQLLSGTNAFICEHCIHEWSARLGTLGTPHGWFSIASPGRAVPVAGEPPEHSEIAESAIRAAFADSGKASEDGVSVPTVERGETLGPVLATARDNRRGIAPQGAEFVTSVDEIVFTDPDHAAVWFSIAVDGRTLLPHHRGDALVVDGVWKVARSTFCNLMALAGVQCPPETG
jgi:hypothetical protein